MFSRDLLTSLGSVSDKVFRIREETSCCGTAQLLQRRAAALPAGLGTREEGAQHRVRAAATAQALSVLLCPLRGDSPVPLGGRRNLPQER